MMQSTRTHNMESQRYVEELMEEQQRGARQRGPGHGFVRWSEMQVLYPRYKSLDDIHLSPEEHAHGWIDLEPYMNAAPPTIPSCASLHRAYKFFRSLGLRHLCVIGKSGELRGILTRKDLTYDNAERHVRLVFEPPMGWDRMGDLAAFILPTQNATTLRPRLLRLCTHHRCLPFFPPPTLQGVARV